MSSTLKTKTLGPVADLEKHLPSDWWKSLFNAVYLKTDGDVVENDDNTAREVDLLIQAAGLKPHHHVLDLCCGQGRHVIEMQLRGFNYVMGVDRSRYLIRVAKRRAQQLGLSVKFSEGDARKVRLAESSLDCVVLFGNSFGYFESQEDDLAVLRSVIHVLKSKSTLVLDLMDGAWMRKHFERRSWEWIDENHLVCRERTLSNDESRIISREVVTHAERGIIADQFYAERLYGFDEIKIILESLDFTDVELHTQMHTDSTRNQDLGMMNKRLFIRAKSPVKAPIQPKRKETPVVMVLMGDPTLPDTVKRNGQFNSEDLETINKLKNALKQLNYQVSYLDNHAKLIHCLQQKKPNFVFNLCDEGFNNKATLELHVPALLEMLGIPYSGSGPACLAFCYNKSLVRSVAQSMEILVPLETYFDPDDQAATLPSIFPAILKPNLGDSSIGITQNGVVNSPEELVNYLERLKAELPDTAILIQEYLVGAEYSVGIIGNPGAYTVLPILAVDFSQLPSSLPKILGYESKWLPDSPYWNKIQYIQATLDLETERQLVDNSLKLFERLGCRDYARFDYRTAENGEVKLLEVNPNPGWCWDGKMNLMAQFAGRTYPEFLDLIMKAALERVGREKCSHSQ